VNESALVALFADPACRFGAIRSLVGGLTATELRHARPTEAAIQALIEGLSDPNPQIRWWCVQLLDHLPDDRSVEALVPVLDDPVPRVRRNAAHALGCIACKPNWSGELPNTALAKLHALAERDPNPKVRAEATLALKCHPPNATTLLRPDLQV
jgi:vesicle coat complex subunit